MKAVIVFLCLYVSSTIAQEMVQVVCSQGSITAKIKKQVVASAGYTMGQVHLNDKNCAFDLEDDEFYMKVIDPLSSCLTHQETNDTHVWYTNSISTVETGPTYPYGVVVGPSSNPRVLSAKITCTFRIDLNVSTMFIPNITIIPIPIPDAFGEGEFQASMSLYTDASYGTPYTEAPTLEADQTLFVGVSLLGVVSEDIYLLIQECWGTISADPEDTPQYPLISDGCSVSSAADGAVQVTRNGISHQGLWNSPVFKFVGGDEDFTNVWLHCDLQVCINKQCEPTCAARRKRRDVGQETKKVYGPDDFNRKNVITLGPVKRLTIETVPDDQIRVTYVEDTDLYRNSKHQAAPNDRSMWNPTVIAVVAVMGSLAFICIIMAIFVIAYRSRSRSSHSGVSLSGIGNKGFVA